MDNAPAREPRVPKPAAKTKPHKNKDGGRAIVA
eukprot:CAMPEP_0203869520 /NCGR_PEP_ID=MMETSP0359-20131031/17757_1 /ASSEMBLY_ACC=CAM_ASM_000338 /TAXON_ID=268821 /ORGANISM="Scrippsiella Hangoei, Strain SHTV-5" /LENGTH=32 /DNA_ID= /DNA_START= /DNA_END= /DNA_ORIENTATION=